MADLTARLQRRIQADFPHQTDRVTALLGALGQEISRGDPDDPEGNERILAAVLLLAEGHLRRLDSAIDLARTDWRDLLVAAGLEHADWPNHLDAELGPPGGPLPPRPRRE